jgi:ribulose-5-phosphate 4-epimerase/fuculose-1-phosphate aldolase
VNYVSGDLRDQLAHVGFEVVRGGLVVGSGGNLSARQPGGDECWVTAAGSWLDRLERPSFVRVRLRDGAVLDDGAVIDAAGVPPQRAPTTELALHLATYRTRPDVNAVVHLHPQSVLLLDALGERIRLVTTDHAFYVRRVVTAPFHPPGTAELAAVAAEACATGVNCVVLSHHGCSVLADSVELAHKRAANLEEAARLTYHALAAGALPRLRECPPEFLARLAAGTQTTA